MAYQLRRSDDDGIPSDSIKSPDDNTYVAVWDSEAESAFGHAIQESDGDVEAWFPFDGEEVHKKGDDFSFLVKDPDYSYTWVKVKRYTKRPSHYNPLTVQNDDGEDIVPASFAGRLGKINLSTMDGVTSFGGEERSRTPEEVKQAMMLCARRKNTDCHLDYQPTQQGAYPPSDAARAHQCRFNSYVVLSTDFDPPQFGRASLNLYIDGLQAWFPYGGEEYAKDDFHLVRANKCTKLYWAPIREVVENPDRYELVKSGPQSPAVLGGVLGKAHIEDMVGWVSLDGEEKMMEEDEVMEGTVLCYKDNEHEHD